MKAVVPLPSAFAFKIALYPFMNPSFSMRLILVNTVVTGEFIFLAISLVESLQFSCKSFNILMSCSSSLDCMLKLLRKTRI